MGGPASLPSCTVRCKSGQSSGVVSHLWRVDNEVAKGETEPIVLSLNPDLWKKAVFLTEIVRVVFWT